MANGPQHENYASWFEQRLGARDAKTEADLLTVADAYDAAIQAGMLSSEQLQRVVEGASDVRTMLWSNASYLLMNLSSKWPAAAEAIATMFQNKKARIRFA